MEIPDGVEIMKGNGHILRVVKTLLSFIQAPADGAKEIKKMGKIVILPNDRPSRATYTDNAELPAFYMGDYSVLGLLVAPYAKAVSVLGQEGYRIIESACGADVTIGAPAEVAKIQLLLQDNGIGAEIADVVEGIYQA